MVLSHFTIDQQSHVQQKMKKIGPRCHPATIFILQMIKNKPLSSHIYLGHRAKEHIPLYSRSLQKIN